MSVDVSIKGIKHEICLMLIESFPVQARHAATH